MRASLTGIVLSVEMTGRGDLTLALLGASLVAMVVAMLLKSEPIYVTLKRRMIERGDYCRTGHGRWAQRGLPSLRRARRLWQDGEDATTDRFSER